MEPPGVISLLLLGLAAVGVFIDIPFVSNYAFWIAIAAYVMLDWSTNWLGIFSFLLMGLAVVGVFIDIPFVSNYAFWVAVVAYFIRFVTRLPTLPPLTVRRAAGKHAVGGEVP